MSTRQLSSSQIANIAEPAFRFRMMLKTVQVVHGAGDLWFPLLNLIATFIDGLASGLPGGTKAAYLAYLGQHFPSLCQSISPADFYDHFRNASVHEFGVRPPFALWRDAELNGQYTGPVTVDGATYTALNIDRLYSDFVNHLRGLGATS